GYDVDLDSGARLLLSEIAQARENLAQALRTGRDLKEHPVRRFRVPGLQRELKPFQLPAVAHMVNVENAANFSVPGSGKTTITLASYAKLKSSGTVGTLVVIGPRASFATWEKEFNSCLGPGSVVRIVGTKPQRAKAWRVGGSADMVLLNYHVASNDRTKLK